jgi:DNA-nicking Smr family endonuclease
VAFRIEAREGRLRGLAEGVDRRHLRRLERGDWEEDAEIDLHGLRRDEARRAVRAALAEAHQEDMRVIRVVHGRGRHSELGPVLREALPEWLTAPPLGRLVMAFASAPADRGGDGATLVLLRRRRGPRA